MANLEEITKVKDERHALFGSKVETVLQSSTFIGLHNTYLFLEKYVFELRKYKGDGNRL